MEDCQIADAMRLRVNEPFSVAEIGLNVYRQILWGAPIGWIHQFNNLYSTRLYSHVPGIVRFLCKSLPLCIFSFKCNFVKLSKFQVFSER